MMTNQELAARAVSVVLMWDPIIAKHLGGVTVTRLRSLAGAAATAAINPPTWLAEATHTEDGSGGLRGPAWRPQPREVVSSTPVPPTIDSGGSEEPGVPADDDPFADIPPLDPADLAD